MNVLLFLNTRTVQTLCASGLVVQFAQANAMLDLEAVEISIEDEAVQRVTTVFRQDI
jgi:hypothetical protein